MKKITITLLSIILCVSLVACSNSPLDEETSSNSLETTPSDNLTDEKDYLLNSIYLTSDFNAQKNLLLEAFNYNTQNADILTLIEKSESSILNDGDPTSMSDGYLYSSTQDGTHVYFKDYGSNFVFWGKYSLWADMYDFQGYDTDDKFYIYYSGDLPNDGDISNTNLISIIPEYQLLNSDATGKKLVEDVYNNYTSLQIYLENLNESENIILSIEEATLKVIEKNNINPEDFYKKELSQGGYYYTNDKISIVVYSELLSGNLPVKYNVYIFESEPSIDSVYTTDLFFIDNTNI